MDVGGWPGRCCRLPPRPSAGSYLHCSHWSTCFCLFVFSEVQALNQPRFLFIRDRILPRANGESLPSSHLLDNLTLQTKYVRYGGVWKLLALQ